MDNSEVILNSSTHAGSASVQQVSPTVYAVAAYYLAGITFFGISLNGMVIFIVYTDKKLMTPMNAILLNIAFADSGIAVLGNPIALYNASYRGWMFGRKMCIVYGFMMSLFGICSIFTLSLLAYQRYHIICRPFSITSHLTWHEAKLCIFGTWLCSFLVSCPPIFGWGSYENEAANISCSINWESRGINPTSYIMFLFAVALGVPIFVIVFSYCNILRRIRYVKKMRQISNVSSVGKAETHVARMIFMMVIAFFLAWGPYAIFSLLIAFSDIELSSESTIAPSLFAKSSVCYNPVIYFVLNNQFRKSLLRRIGVPRSQDENTDDIKQVPMSNLRVSQPLERISSS